MRPPQRFETQRLVLRVPQMSDAQAIFDGYATDPAVTRYMTWRPHESIDQTRAFLEATIAEWSGREELHLRDQRRARPIGASAW